MQKVFDFSNVKKCELTISSTWDEFRNELKNKCYNYDDLSSAKQSVFLKVFDDLFSHGYCFFEKKAKEILSENVQVTRASHLNKNEPSPTYERMIPIAKYITKHNRFSPPGVEWLYLAFGSGNYEKYTISETCALRECRTNIGDRMAICDFKLNNDYYEKKIVDLTVAKSCTFKDINDELEVASKQIKNKEFDKLINLFFHNKILRTSQIDVSGLIKALEKWSIYTYAKLLSEQIFLPIETEDRDIMYAPFQCLAQYFISKGYWGIVYSSTVFPDGNNIVLFDKNSAVPVGKVKDIVF